MIAARLRRWSSRLVERLLGRYHEGPGAPGRLEQVVVDFANLNPRASRAEWTVFAVEHGRACYETGWQRGFEYVERERGEWWPDPSPEEVADQEDPGWRDSPPVVLEDPWSRVTDDVGINEP